MLADNNSLILLGDFNIHINEESGDDSNNFKDTMEALGMMHMLNFQHIRPITQLITSTLNSLVISKLQTVSRRT